MAREVEVCKADETLNRAALGAPCGSWISEGLEGC